MTEYKLCTICFLMFKKAKCPKCSKKMPLFLFSATRKRGGKGDDQFTSCPSCNAFIHAKSSEAHQKNFLWIFLVPLFATPVIFSIGGIVPNNFIEIYFLFCYALCFLGPVIHGQHQMDFFESNEAEMNNILNKQAAKETDHV